MTVPVDSLTALANTLQIAPTGPIEPGGPVSAKLVPDASRLRLTDAIPGKLELAMISKDVKFTDSDVESLDIDLLSDLNAKILDASTPRR